MFGRDRLGLALGAGIAMAAILMAAFMRYQENRFEGLQRMFKAAESEGASH
jgi:hypothetical protein